MMLKESKKEMEMVLPTFLLITVYAAVVLRLLFFAKTCVKNILTNFLLTMYEADNFYRLLLKCIP